MNSIPTFQSFNSTLAPDSLPSLSCPSEPPDVGNWFPSYQYQSPDPDSNVGFEESHFRGCKSQRDEEEGKEAILEKVKTPDEVVAEKKLAQCRSSTCVEDDKHNEELSLTKSQDSFSPQSLLSEPPDIRNWFSSYVYESFVPDTCSMYKDVSSSEDNECEEEMFQSEDNESFVPNTCSMHKDEHQSENVHPKGFVEHNSPCDENTTVNQLSSRGDGSVEAKRSPATTSTSHLEKILQPWKQDKALQYNISPTKYGETLRLNHGSLGCSREARKTALDVKDGSDHRTPEMVQKNDMIEAKSKSKIQQNKVEISTSLAKSSSARSSTCTSNKENDGFVSARKDRYLESNGENSWKKPEKLSFQSSTNTGRVPLACEKQGVTKRKALTEATNVLQQCNAMETTGKWRCPQKGKPYVGPALKQLRLEKWVRRV